MTDPTLVVYYTITKTHSKRIPERCAFLFYGTLQELPREITDRGLACRRVVGPVRVRYMTEAWEASKHLILRLKTDAELLAYGKGITIP